MNCCTKTTLSGDYIHFNMIIYTVSHVNHRNIPATLYIACSKPLYYINPHRVPLILYGKRPYKVKVYIIKLHPYHMRHSFCLTFILVRFIKMSFSIQHFFLLLLWFSLLYINTCYSDMSCWRSGSLYWCSITLIPINFVHNCVMLWKMYHVLKKFLITLFSSVYYSCRWVKILPIIPSRISQKILPIFFFYSCI